MCHIKLQYSQQVIIFLKVSDCKNVFKFIPEKSLMLPYIPVIFVFYTDT